MQRIRKGPGGSAAQLFAEAQARITERRLEMGLLPAGWREPIDLGDFLVEVWRLHSVGRDDDARNLLARVWAWGMDVVAEERELRVALRLAGRLGYVTDDEEGWRALPSEFEIYRAESDLNDPERGYCWTLDLEVAEMHSKRHDLSITRGSVRKEHVLAYVTHWGEQEIVVRREHVEPPRMGTNGH